MFCYTLQTHVRLSHTRAYNLPSRAHSCLMLQAHLDLYGKLVFYRPVRLAQMKHILTDQTIPKMFSFVNESTDGEEEDSFLHCRESPRVVRDEHLPDVQKRVQRVSTEIGASPTLVENKNDEEGDFYSIEELRLAWLKSATLVSFSANQ